MTLSIDTRSDIYYLKDLHQNCFQSSKPTGEVSEQLAKQYQDKVKQKELQLNKAFRKDVIENPNMPFCFYIPAQVGNIPIPWLPPTSCCACRS